MCVGGGGLGVFAQPTQSSPQLASGKEGGGERHVHTHTHARRAQEKVGATMRQVAATHFPQFIAYTSTP